MNTKFTPFFVIALVAGLTACAGTPETTTPYLDQHFGEAVNQAKAQQTINPDAPRNPDPVAGIDGKAGEAVIDRYYEGTKEEAAPATIINIGGGLGGN